MIGDSGFYAVLIPAVPSFMQFRVQRFQQLLLHNFVDSGDSGDSMRFQNCKNYKNFKNLKNLYRTILEMHTFLSGFMRFYSAHVYAFQLLDQKFLVT